MFARSWCAAVIIVAFLAGASAHAAGGKPSRAAVKGCTWEKKSDPAIGLDAWVQRCDFGFRKIDFVFAGNALA